MADDPTRVRSQAALTTSSGGIWLIVGGAFTAVSLAVLIPMTQLPPPGVALGGSIAVGALYLAMVVVRLTVHAIRRRLALLAAGMLGIAVIALATAVVVASSATVA